MSIVRRNSAQLARVLRSVECGYYTATEIEEVTGIRRGVVSARLADLEEVGALKRHGTMRHAHAGRPKIVWRLA